MSTGCFERIQAFLLSEPHKDSRSSAPVSDHQSTEIVESGVELERLDHRKQHNDTIIFDHATVSRGDQTSDLVLRDVDLQIKTGSLSMVVGVVGSGKSTLLKAALGEVKCSSGSIYVASGRVAYCSQTPWLPNATIREIVIGNHRNEDDDQAWYTTVMRACAMAEDILQFPEKDDTLIGSRGVTLSGGQKQRLVGVSDTNACSKLTFTRPLLEPSFLDVMLSFSMIFSVLWMPKRRHKSWRVCSARMVFFVGWVQLYYSQHTQFIIYHWQTISLS